MTHTIKTPTIKIDNGSNFPVNPMNLPEFSNVYVTRCLNNTESINNSANKQNGKM